MVAMAGAAVDDNFVIGPPPFRQPPPAIVAGITVTETIR